MGGSPGSLSLVGFPHRHGRDCRDHLFIAFQTCRYGIQALGYDAVSINMKKARYIPRHSDTCGAYLPFGWMGLSHMGPWFSRSLRQTHEQPIQTAGRSAARPSIGDAGAQPYFPCANQYACATQPSSSSSRSEGSLMTKCVVQRPRYGSALAATRADSRDAGRPSESTK